MWKPYNVLRKKGKIWSGHSLNLKERIKARRLLIGPRQKAWVRVLQSECEESLDGIYTGVSLLIQWKLVDSCSHVALMHEKTLLIQLNFSPKKWPREWQRVEKTHLIRFQIIRKNAFDPPIAIMFSYWLKNGWVINIFSWGGSNMFFRRVVIFRREI